MMSSQFGPSSSKEGVFLFRLWAPTAQQVELLLNVGQQVIAMQPTENGFYSCKTQYAKPGTHYQFRIDGNLIVPDPASRYQPQDVHGASCLVTPDFDWQDGEWRGRPWEEAVIYELHIGTFTPEGTFQAVIDKLDYLVQLGITAIELMPVSDFPGAINWGYDGVFPYAPDSCYGDPDDLKMLVQASHQKGLMVFLDVVYNHFGPEGNYLHAYAAPFFTSKHQTPWGDAINFDDTHSEIVRSFFIENALYWLTEFHLDGLRMDAVQAIYDQSERHILETLAKAVQAGPGQDRMIHLMLENEDNLVRYLADGPGYYTAQWNDDIHHALHVLITGETGGYYADYAENPTAHLGRCLTEGFDYQGQPSHYRGGILRGEISMDLPLTRFISFIQNHDQVGNRAFGERITVIADPEKIQVAVAVFILSPQIPMLFMGEEWACDQPFPFFCDFEPDLAQKVTEGRRHEFAKFSEFSDPKRRAQIPDPSDIKTFQSAVLNWEALNHPEKQVWLKYYQTLIDIRHREIVPLLKMSSGRFKTDYQSLGSGAFQVSWEMETTGEKLYLMANFGDDGVSCQSPLKTQMLFETRPTISIQVTEGQLPASAAVWFKQEGLNE